ncbi:division/cell wall cluster transcriptional repressor MraZ [Granulosicoccus sp. 3-233]|uniref:division/cell wall cluster transcriptional repressor MraZ n=1 Tax=Granulosicoccus sp. 3-233 TaxID=3417969 RepID=UPI003D34571E
MRFRGITKLSVDAKGRLAMPKNHRDNLEKNAISDLVVTVDNRSAACLLIYPMAIYEEIERKLMELPNHSAEARKVQRLFIGYATELELDATGRMLLPAELREYAGIGRKAFLIGQGNKFELWDEQAWEHECEKWKQEESDPNSADAPAELLNISF